MSDHTHPSFKYEGWMTRLNGVIVAVMVWDGKSAAAVELFCGAEFKHIRPDDHVLALGPSSTSQPDRYVRPGDFLLAYAEHPNIIVIRGDVPWARKILGGKQ